MHGVDIENMITSAAKRIRLNECAELATRTSDHIFNIHDVQLIIIFISLTKIKDIVEKLSNRILPNLAHLLILCVFTSVLCGVNKEVNENNNNNKQPNPILAFYIQTWGAQTTI